MKTVMLGMCLVTGVWNEGKMSPGGREMVTSGGEREERRAWTPDSSIVYTPHVPNTSACLV